MSSFMLLFRSVRCREKAWLSHPEADQRWKFESSQRMGTDSSRYVWRWAPSSPVPVRTLAAVPILGLAVAARYLVASKQPC